MKQPLATVMMKGVIPMDHPIKAFIAYFVTWFATVAVMIMISATTSLLFLPIIFLISTLRFHGDTLLPYGTKKTESFVYLVLVIFAGVLTAAVICELPAIHILLF